jgi:hypothetical protein
MALKAHGALFERSVSLPKKPNGILPLFTRLSIARSTSICLSDIFCSLVVPAAAGTRNLARMKVAIRLEYKHMITHLRVDVGKRLALHGHP